MNNEIDHIEQLRQHVRETLDIHERDSRLHIAFSQYRRKEITLEQYSIQQRLYGVDYGAAATTLAQMHLARTQSLEESQQPPYQPVTLWQRTKRAMFGNDDL